MSEAKLCQQCGGPLPKDDVLGGRCLRCMLELGLETSPDRSKDTLGVDTVSGSRVPPVSLGRYRILQVIGEGGMGVVYEAEQDQPRRTVALKIIKPGLVSDELIRRFEQESQALGRLQHPGIAQIYEAGTVDTGFGPQPYFAMELIHGKSPRDYAESRHLNISQRLEIMVKICNAVHHAHQRGLIHRDLKPGNILVDDTGQPKILDFGVARATDSDTRATLQTDIGQLVGTLAYMSPEQALADPLDIDTRSDVYTLGVILYELLTGRLPYTISKKLHEAIHAIREEEPARLSAVNRAYRGDIETIVGKALEKDRTRRYASAAGMAADLQRYLNDEPIAARPPSASYQLQKFARRHKALVAGGATVLFVLVGGIIASMHQATRAHLAEIAAVKQSDRATVAEKLATTERDLALSLVENIKIADTRAIQERDKALVERKRADDETAIARHQYLLNTWKSLSRESVRDSSNRVDDDLAALLARQAVLMHALTSKEARYLVEEALQQAAHLERWAHTIPLSVHSVAFSPAGELLASGGFDGTIRLLDLGNPGASPILLKGHQAAVSSLAFSPDKLHLVSGGFDKTVRIWDLRNTGAPSAMLGGPQDIVNSVAYSPDGVRLASGGADKIVRIWDLRNPGLLPTLLEGPQGSVNSVAFSSTGDLIAAASSDGVRIWDLRNPKSLPVLLEEPQATVGTPPVRVAANSVAFSPNGALIASAGADSTVRVWDLRNLHAMPILLKGHQFGVISISFSPDGKRLASGGSDFTVRVWDLQKLEVAPVMLSGGDLVSSVAFSPDGKRLASGGYQLMRVWDLWDSGAPRGLFRGAISGVDSDVFASDGSRFASAGRDSIIRVLDLDHPEVAPKLLKGHQGGVLALVFSPDGKRLASGGIDGSARIWNLSDASAPALVVPIENPHSIRSMAFSPDGSLLAFNSIDRIMLFDLRRPGVAPVLVQTGVGKIPQGMAFSPDGWRLATADGVTRTVRVFDLRNPSAAPMLLEGHQEIVDILSSVDFSPDGTRLAAGGGGKTVRVWDLRSPEALPVLFEGPQGSVKWIKFSLDGTQLLSFDRQGRSLLAWPLWTAASDYLCTRVWRNLSMDEWRLEVGEGIPYERTCQALPPGAGAPGSPK